jgi:hypothetical protein
VHLITDHVDYIIQKAIIVTVNSRNLASYPNHGWRGCCSKRYCSPRTYDFGKEVNMTTIGDRVKDIEIQSALTHTTFATVCGFSVSELDNLEKLRDEKDVSETDRRLLLDMCDFFRVDIKSVLREQDGKESI